MFKGKKVLLGVTGGIAAYKMCTLVNLLKKEGAEVRVIMTEAGTKFVSPITFQALSSHAVYVNMFDCINSEEVEHISLAKWADVMVVAPATANTIGKIAHGLADNLLTTVLMALEDETKVVIAPAMNDNMWNNKMTQKNMEILAQQEDDYRIVGPKVGMLACGDKGVGKIADNESILKEIKSCLK